MTKVLESRPVSKDDVFYRNNGYQYFFPVARVDGVLMRPTNIVAPKIVIKALDWSRRVYNRFVADYESMGRLVVGPDVENRSIYDPSYKGIKYNLDRAGMKLGTSKGSRAWTPNVGGYS